MSTGAKIIIGIVVGVVILGLTCIGGIVAFGFYVAGNVPEGIDIGFEYPDDVAVGDEFELVVTVYNDLNEKRTLGDLDFYQPILDGVKITDIDPAPSNDDGEYLFGMRTLTYNDTIPANGEYVVTLTLLAEESGYYSGDVDVTIDGMLSIYSTYQMLVIEEE